MSEVSHTSSSNSAKAAFSIAEFSEMFDMAERTGWALVQKREIAHMRVGRRVLITREAIEDFKKKNTVPAVDGKAIAREILR